MKNRLRLLAVFALAIIGGYLAYPSVLEGAGRFLIVRDKLEPAGVIIVLAGDDNGERVAEAVRLYRAGYARKLLLSGGPLYWRVTAAALMKRHAEVLGVPASALILEDRSRSTLDNARFSLPLVRRRGFKSAILVTSPTHSRRAKRVFLKVFKQQGVKIISWPARVAEFKLPGWWTRHEDTQLVVWEYVSLIFYLLRGY